MATTEARYVAVSTDNADRWIYAGPRTEPLPEAPAGRQWMPEYQALAIGFSYPANYEPEEWAPREEVATQIEQTNAETISTALRRQLARSNTFLANPPASTGIPALDKTIMRHERTLNLLTRAMLELFDTAPPEYVTNDPEASR